MIVDKLSNAQAYFGMHPLFEKAFEYIHSLDPKSITPQQVEIDGQKLKATVMEVDLREEKDARLEKHRQYIDIQVPFTHQEAHGWKAAADLKEPDGEFDTTNDIGFFHDRPTTFVSVLPGEFVIFFPEDAHAPFVGEGKMTKMIVKIAVEP